MKSRGITLIALVVTVVILLILAGVAIAMLIGPDGTIQKAKDSEIASRYSIILDRIKLREANLGIPFKLGEDVEDDTQVFISNLESEGLYISSEDKFENGLLKIGKIEGTENYRYEIPLFSFTSPKNMIVTVDTTIPAKRVQILFFNSIGLQVDWGDGNITEITTESSYVKNTYQEPGNYQIKIIGDSNGGAIQFISSLGEELDFKKLIQWGENGFSSISWNNYSGFPNQTEIPIPTEKSFENLEYCCYLFSNSQITTIPDNLFKNAKKLKSVRGLFSTCSSLTSIPSTLLDNSPDITDFRSMFFYCINLEGNAPTWWERPLSNTFTKTTCFSGCDKLNNYDEIPNDWKLPPPPQEG